jgi:hypothetical protein
LPRAAKESTENIGKIGQNSKLPFLEYKSKTVSTEPAFLVCIFFYPFLLYRTLTVSRFFIFLLSYTIGRTPWTGDQPVARPLPKYTITQTQNKSTHTPNIHTISGIRTHDHGLRENEDRSATLTGVRIFKEHYLPISQFSHSRGNIR